MVQLVVAAVAMRRPHPARRMAIVALLAATLAAGLAAAPASGAAGAYGGGKLRFTGSGTFALDRGPDSWKDAHYSYNNHTQRESASFVLDNEVALGIVPGGSQAAGWTDSYAIKGLPLPAANLGTAAWSQAGTTCQGLWYYGEWVEECANIGFSCGYAITRPDNPNGLAQAPQQVGDALEVPLVGMYFPDLAVTSGGEKCSTKKWSHISDPSRVVAAVPLDDDAERSSTPVASRPVASNCDGAEYLGFASFTAPAKPDPCTQSMSWTGTVELGCAVCITDLKVEHRIPSGGWEPVPDTGTYDGNEVRFTATVENRTNRQLDGPFFARESDTRKPLALALPAATQTYPAGSVATLEHVWDTSGWSWEDGAAHPERRVQVTTGFGAKTVDLVVKPRPVVLVHGWNSGAATWAGYGSMLAAEHPLWKAYAVGDGKYAGVMDTDPKTGASVSANATAVDLYVEQLRKDLGAMHVDLVVHSMGGLISRQYVQERMGAAADDRPIATHLVMLGTPNRGSACADVLLPPIQWAGYPGVPTMQLTPGWAAGFNTRVVNRAGVRFSIYIGVLEVRTCTDPEKGDGVVSQVSAKHDLADHLFALGVNHVEMTSAARPFTSFVRPRLALDPEQAKAERAAPASREASADAAPRNAAAGDPTPPQAVASDVELGASGQRDVPIPIDGGTRLTAALLAPSPVTAALIDPAGDVAMTQAAGSAEAMQPVRVLAADAPSAGTWTLRLTETAGAPARVTVGAAIDGSPSRLDVSATRPAGSGTLTLRATPTRAGAKVAGATVIARVAGEDGSVSPVTLTERPDGVHEGTATVDPAAQHSASFEARAPGFLRYGSAIVTSDATPAPGDQGGAGGPGAGDGTPPGVGPTPVAPTGGVPAAAPDGGRAPSTVAKPSPRLAVRLVQRRLDIDRRGRVRLVLRNPEKATLRLSYTLTTAGKRPARLARGTVRLPGGRSRTVTARLGKAATRRMRRSRTTRAVLRLTARRASGALAGTAKLAVTIRPR